MTALLIGLVISFALGGLVYLNFEDEINEARETTEDNGVDLDDFDLSDFDQKPDADALAENSAVAEDHMTAQTFAAAQTPAQSPVPFQPDEEQIVVELHESVDMDAPAQYAFDPETDTTTLSIGQNAVLSLQGDQTDISIGFGTLAETKTGLSPFDIVLIQNRLEPA